MEAVGQLTGGLAHDFNNLLTAVVGNLDLIRARATEPRITRLAENAFKAAERGSKLTAQLLAFSRTQKLATESVDLNRLIVDASELLNHRSAPASRSRPSSMRAHLSWSLIATSWKLACSIWRSTRETRCRTAER